MNSLSDPSNFGAKPIDTQRFYGSEPVGEGRWAMLDGLGLLWTDDRDALQLDVVEGVDGKAANALRRELNRSAAAGMSATTAFNTTVADHGSAPVVEGQLVKRSAP
ncbi:hypothetical protein ACIGGF_04320 [Rhodococcus sp. NPDC078407]|uniref:hypothetical protein n=1 Tax=Rhodococcus sp. NPDC078407 TaxID=3364509 RepID=UPI0037C72A98